MPDRDRLLHGPAEVVADGDGVLAGADVRQQYRELVPAEARDPAPVAQPLLEALADKPQQLVAGATAPDAIARIAADAAPSAPRYLLGMRAPSMGR